MEENLNSFKELYANVIDEKQTVKFLTSCVSEGLIPPGLRNPFNLAKDDNIMLYVAIAGLSIPDPATRTNLMLLVLYLVHVHRKKTAEARR